MSSFTLFKSIFTLDGFQRKYKPLLYRSVIDQFSIQAYEGPYGEIDVAYLLMCASIFAESDDAKHLDTAFRIAQFVLQQDGATEVQKNSAVYILEKMTNHPTVNLAISRNKVEADYKDSIPTEFNLDSMKRLMKYSIYDPNNETIVPINKFQYDVLEESEKNDWVSISAPTSVGKSFILLQLIKIFLEGNTEGTIIYIVPTRALIQQVEQDIRKMLIENKLTGVFVTTVPLPGTENNDYPKRIFIFTQERLQWLLTEEKDLTVNMLIVDEAQKIGDGSRGVLLQQVIEDVGRKNPKGKVIFSSPMTANPEALLETGYHQIKKETVEREFVTVNQNLIWVDQVFRKPKEWQMSLCVEDQLVPIGKFFLEDKPTNDIERLALVSHALSDPMGGNLIYSNLPSSAEKCAEKLWELQGEENESTHPEIRELIKLIQDVIDPDYTLSHVLTRKIGYHYGNMPLIIKNEIERLFSEGIIEFLVCTSTLIEGMNLPARSIFVRGPQKGRGTPMSEMDFWNLAGRAGRQGKEFQGNVICIDTNKEEIWNYEPPKTRKKYRITKTIDLLISDTDELVKYIKEGTPRETSLKKPELEYGFSYLVGEHIRNPFGLLSSPALQKYEEETIEELQFAVAKALKDVEVPNEIILKHPGVSPVAQQKLLDFFNHNFFAIEMYLPVHPSSPDALDQYIKIVEKIQDTFSGEHPGKNYHYTLLILEWMRGYPLSRIIRRNWKYWRKQIRPKSLQSVIRETMQDIEEFARFKFVKYFSCYRDILNYFLELNDLEMNEDLKDVNLWLELGTSELTQISLIGLGFTRTTALIIAEIIVDSNLTAEECIQLLMQINWDKLPLSSIIQREINQFIELYDSQIDN
ncbi:DEAD/DEAH box helicase [Heyndrickxia sp. MSNUG]|uniref:DEAD/DEAH box helicase n=1 Tax=Heyndrickxia sp. MSNUG TaxID=3136677 RepID=UPI003C2E5FB2